MIEIQMAGRELFTITPWFCNRGLNHSQRPGENVVLSISLMPGRVNSMRRDL
jgi:hypothetical protein